jgi:serine/threonine protein kinase
MACLTEDTVLRFVRGDLSEPAIADVDTHIEACPDCRGLVADVSKSFHDTETGTRERSVIGTDDPEVSHERARLSLENGQRVGRYVIEEPIARGGMGVLYAAHDPRLSRKVALKLLRPDVPSVGRHRGPSLLREAQAMAQLSHPNVVNVYDVGTFHTQVFIAMEFVDGLTLKSWLRARPRSWRDILAAFVEAGTGLAAAHAVGLVHRDFKPDNVMVGVEGRVRVTDFGLARSFDESESDEPRDGSEPRKVSTSLATWDLAATLTKTGTLKGTPAYMAPEQFCCMRPDARTDQFSFCVALYEALYGFRPFDAKTDQELVANVLEGRVRPPPTTSDVPPSVGVILGKGLSAARDERFPSMGALLSALRTESALRPPTRRRNLGRVLLLGAGLALGTSVAGFTVLRTRPTSPAELRVASDEPSRAQPSVPVTVATAVSVTEPVPPATSTAAEAAPVAGRSNIRRIAPRIRENKARPASSPPRATGVPSSEKAYDDLPLAPSFVRGGS